MDIDSAVHALNHRRYMRESYIFLWSYSPGCNVRIRKGKICSRCFEEFKRFQIYQSSLENKTAELEGYFLQFSCKEILKIFLYSWLRLRYEKLGRLLLCLGMWLRKPESYSMGWRLWEYSYSLNFFCGVPFRVMEWRYVIAIFLIVQKQ